jgi:molybdenum cofactor biosynthesis enzyme MoaA
MKINTLSIVVGTAACNAACPFCVSKMTATEAPKDTHVNWQNFDIACRLASRNGACTALLTGKGEPTLYPELISQYIRHLDKHAIPLIELQTNGVALTREYLTHWYSCGLSLVCISITDYNPVRSNELMKINGAHAGYNFWHRVEMLHHIGLTVRLNCTLLRSGIGTIEAVENLINACKLNGVEQLTVRDVTRPACNNAVAECVDREFVNLTPKLNTYLGANAVVLLRLPHGGIIYDYRDQNICVSNCLTSSTNVDDIRQLIFFPNGTVAYDWKYKAARLL